MCFSDKISTFRLRFPDVFSSDDLSLYPRSFLLTLSLLQFNLHTSRLAVLSRPLSRLTDCLDVLGPFVSWDSTIDSVKRCPLLRSAYLSSWKGLECSGRGAWIWRKASSLLEQTVLSTYYIYMNFTKKDHEIRSAKIRSVKARLAKVRSDGRNKTETIYIGLIIQKLDKNEVNWSKEEQSKANELKQRQVGP